MEIIRIKEDLDPHHYQEPLEYDNNPGDHYKINRGMDDILSASILPFNHFSHLGSLAEATTDRVRVLESGCGQAKALFDLKKGITFIGEDIHLTDLLVMDVDTQYMLTDLFRRELNGLGSKIHTTGITLSYEHANFAQSYDEVFRPDRMIVGSLKTYSQTTSDRYDFIYDHLGVAIRFPKMAIPAFSRLLDVNSMGLFRLSIFRTSIEEIQKLISSNGLEIVDCRKPKLGNQFVLEVLAGKVA